MVWSGSHVFRKKIPAKTLFWSERDEHGVERVNRLDRTARERLLWKDPMRARFYSNLLANFLVPMGAAGLALSAGIRGGGGPMADVLAVNEAMVYAGMMSQATKLLIRRQRPFARYASSGLADPSAGIEHHIPDELTAAPDGPAARPSKDALRNQADDDDFSFFSGHTSTTAAFAFAVSQIATRRRVRTPLVFLLGIASGLTGYLRIASDRHYMSDVLVGAMVGAVVGTYAPRVLHPVPKEDRWGYGFLTDLGLLAS
ncbi:phosphoesterase PA-phosphatase related protein [Vulgatibacter incomptus]|uniref:Phosphoesterase PA-phosphatase related protein n=1 Tax=Vulgatibacter incomptus TaxID=1391653 RepID=A0A0K1PG53_9BACT|nr:phosphoesterase PA-phosphatase related protein [Vulgatibacter incomptus]